MASIAKRAFLILVCMSCLALALDHGETYFSFQFRFRSELDSLTKVISIDNVKGTTVFAYATDKQFEKFKSLGYFYTILPHPGTLYSPNMAARSKISGALSLTAYPTYSQYVAMMQQFASTYPTLCVIENIGSSVNGRSLLVAKITSNVIVETQKPCVFLTSSMHGDETAGYIILLKLMDYLLTNAATVPRVTAILNNTAVYINPLANPDGTYFGGDNTVFGARRFNANGVDLNRNAPLFTSGLPGNDPFQLETLAMMAFADNHSIALSVNFHGGAEVVNYPWDAVQRRHADDAWFITASLAYAQEAQADGPAGYFTDVSSNGITNGYDWYQVFGSRQDYMTFWKRGREVTIELSKTKLIPEASFDNYYNYNRDAILGYIEEARYGIRGVVTDAATGQPLAASVEIGGHDVDRSGVWTNPRVGDYHRFLSPGAYTATVRAVGYTPRTFSNITVSSGQSTTLDVALLAAANPVGFVFAKNSAAMIGMNRNSGDLESHGIAQISPYDRGLRLRPATGSGTTFDNDGNLTCAAIAGNQASFLNTPSNLTGGLVFRDDLGYAVAHVSADGVIRVRGGYAPGFSVQ
jgi:hypothetical protein